MTLVTIERWGRFEFNVVWNKIWPVYREAFTNGAYAGQELDAEYSKSLCEDMFEKGGFGFLAKRSQEYLGFLVVAPAVCDESLPQGVCANDAISIAELAVRRNCRGSGIGSQLVQQVLDETHNTIFVRTPSENSGAIRFYERHGFEHLADVSRTRTRLGKSVVQSKTYLWLPR